MPPRRRLAPPPTNSSPASPPPPDVDPVTMDPEASSPRRDRDSAPPTISTGILANLQLKQREVYRLTFEAGNRGMTVKDLCQATGLTNAAVGNQARALVRLQVLKEVQDVRYPKRKLYMAAEFKPSDEISGGSWYHDGKVDADAIAAARRRCLAQVTRRGAATTDMIREGIKRDEPRTAYARDRIADILRILVLDRSLEEVRSTGEGLFAAVPRGMMCYRVLGSKQAEGMMEGIPCGICPLTDECLPEGVISPSTCIYYQKWLQMDF